MKKEKIYKANKENGHTQLKQLISTIGISILGLSKRIGVSQQVLYNYVNGRTPSLEVIEKILLSYPNVNAEWLITGKGNMFKEKESALTKEEIRRFRDMLNDYLENI